MSNKLRKYVANLNTQENAASPSYTKINEATEATVTLSDFILFSAFIERKLMAKNKRAVVQIKLSLGSTLQGAFDGCVYLTRLGQAKIQARSTSKIIKD